MTRLSSCYKERDWDRNLSSEGNEHAKYLRMAQRYFIRDETLYRRGDVIRSPRRVLTTEEVLPLIRSAHEGNDEYLGYNTVAQFLAKK